MKNLLLISLGFCFNFNLFSQVTIDLDNLPGIGLDVSIGIDSFELKNYGSSGTNNVQTWDFTHLYPDFEDTLSYVSVLQTPFSQMDSSNADFALSLGDGFMNNLSSSAGLSIDSAHIFFNVDSSGMHGIAMAAQVDGMDAVLIATDPEVFFPVPMQIGQSFQDTARYEVVLGDTTLIHYVYKTITVDGFGSLSLSQGTFPVIRLVENSITIDSLCTSYIFNGVTYTGCFLINEDTANRISFLTNDTLHKHPLVTLALENSSDTSSVKFTTWIWDGTYPQNSISEKSINIIKNAYPNPVKDELMLEISSKESTDIDVLFLDINGRIVKRSSTSVNSGSNLLSMQLSGFATGTYFMALKSEGKLLGCWPFKKL